MEQLTQEAEIRLRKATSNILTKMKKVIQIMKSQTKEAKGVTTIEAWEWPPDRRTKEDSEEAIEEEVAKTRRI